MPTYDYQCTACKKTYELRESFSAALEHTCEKCGKGTAKRLLTAPRIVFKGSGWYVTDSRNKTAAVSDNGSGESAASDTPATSGGSSSSDSSSSASSIETASAAS